MPDLSGRIDVGVSSRRHIENGVGADVSVRPRNGYKSPTGADTEVCPYANCVSRVNLKTGLTMNRLRAVFIAIVALAVLEGCYPRKDNITWMYKAEPPSAGSVPLIDKRVAVLPLADKREQGNTDLIGMFLIPVMPFGWTTLNTPEDTPTHMRSKRWFFKPSEDLSKGVAEEFNNSGVFKEAFFTFKDSEGDLILRGELKSTQYRGKEISYGLCLSRVFLMIVGLPGEHVANELEISFVLEDPTTKQVLWEDSYKKESSTFYFLYYLPQDFYYDALLKEIMKEAIGSLKLKLAQAKL